METRRATDADGRVADADPSSGIQTARARRSTWSPEVATPSGVLPSEFSAAGNVRKPTAGQPTEGEGAGTSVAQLSPYQDADRLCLSISDLAASCGLGLDADEQASNWHEPDNLERQLFDSISGQLLDPSLVQEARRKELEFVHVLACTQGPQHQGRLKMGVQ